MRKKDKEAVGCKKGGGKEEREIVASGVQLIFT